MSQTPEELEAEIALKRAELADTVDALTAKLDVKSQAQAKVADVKTSVIDGAHHLADRATTDGGRPRPEVVAAVAGTVLLVAVLVWWRRR